MKLDKILLQSEEFNKMSDYPLKENVENWSQEILMIAKQIYPDLPLNMVSVNLDKVDEEKGFGIGELLISNIITGEKNIEKNLVGSIPLIIKNFECEPLDLFLRDGRVHYLTPDRLHQLIFNPELFAGKQRHIVPLLESTLVPNVNSSVIPTISNRIATEDKVTFASDLSADEVLKQRLMKKAGDLVNTILNAETKTASEIWTEINGISKNPIYINKDASDTYHTYSFDWKTNKMEKQSMDKYAAKEWFKSNDTEFNYNQEEYYIYPENVKKADADIMKEIINYFSPIKETGYFTVVTMDNKKRTMIVMPLYLLQTRRFNHKFIAIDSKDFDYGIQSSVMGVKLRKANPTDLPDKVPQIGDYGVFYFLNKAGSGISFEPISIASVEIHDDREFKFIAHTMMGQRFEIIPTPGLTDVMNGGKNKIYIPVDTKFIKLNKWVEIKENIEQIREVQKMASDLSYGLNISLNRSPSGTENISVSFNYRESKSEDKKIENISKSVEYGFSSISELKGFLTSFNFDEKAIENVINELNTKRYISLVNVQKPDIDEINDEARKTIDKFISNMKVNLTKQAAELEDRDMIDTVLSLNFINPQNIQQFVLFVPKFEEIESKLGELLITQRLGLDSIPEGAIEDALRGISETITALKTLQ